MAVSCAPPPLLLLPLLLLLLLLQLLLLLPWSYEFCFCCSGLCMAR
jgi:hypothetical protein